MALGGDFFAIMALLGGMEGPLGDLIGTSWANVKEYKENLGF